MDFHQSKRAQFFDGQSRISLGMLKTIGEFVSAMRFRYARLLWDGRFSMAMKSSDRFGRRRWLDHW